MFSSTSVKLTGRFSARAAFVLHAAIILGLALIVFSVSRAQSSTDNARSFLRDLVGEWIGVCEQSTDGERAEDKYFHAAIKQMDANTFDCKFDYYRSDAVSGAPIWIGQSSVTSTIGADGMIKNTIVGKGTVIVDKRPKSQEHKLTEVLQSTGPSGMQGQGSGRLSVYGMPLGLGKNGKINNAKSIWTLSNGVLTIGQILKASFRAFIFTKRFSFEARYTARRGSNVASLMPRTAQVSYRPRSSKL